MRERAEGKKQRISLWLWEDFRIIFGVFHSSISVIVVNRFECSMNRSGSRQFNLSRMGYPTLVDGVPAVPQRLFFLC